MSWALFFLIQSISSVFLAEFLLIVRVYSTKQRNNLTTTFIPTPFILSQAYFFPRALQSLWLSACSLLHRGESSSRPCSCSGILWKAQFQLWLFRLLSRYLWQQLIALHIGRGREFAAKLKSICIKKNKCVPILYLRASFKGPLNESKMHKYLFFRNLLNFCLFLCVKAWQFHTVTCVACHIW